VSWDAINNMVRERKIKKEKNNEFQSPNLLSLGKERERKCEGKRERERVRGKEREERERERERKRESGVKTAALMNKRLALEKFFFLFLKCKN